MQARHYLLLALILGIISTGPAGAAGEPVNLMSLQEGALPVTVPPNYGGWEAENLLDESPKTGWACEGGRVRDNVFVFELAAPAVLERFVFDAASVDAKGAGARDVRVEVSTTSAHTGFTGVLDVSLAEGADGQSFEAASKIAARWVRLTLRNNHGNEKWTELLSFRAYGPRPDVSELPGDISGTYRTSYALFHVRQQGTALIGCYELGEGVLEGAIEGRVMKITWEEGGGKRRGPAVMVFSPDGKSFRGYWWREGFEEKKPHGKWDGTKISDQVGGCPHWSGSVGGELKKDLSATGRARLYGILFDLDSATLRPESRPVLDEVLGLLRGEPTWTLTIEGHTDATGTEAHNQKLSEARAGAVRAYLVDRGVDSSRLKAVGFGEAKPVADNQTELGRARNRRVELVRE